MASLLGLLAKVKRSICLQQLKAASAESLSRLRARGLSVAQTTSTVRKDVRPERRGP